MPDRIHSQDLTPADLPGPDAAWEAVQRFALTFDGYEHAEPRYRPGDPTGSCRQLHDDVIAAIGGAEVAPESVTLDDLRAALFFIARRVRWGTWDGVPTDEDLERARRLIGCIRRRLRARNGT
jgi:hypothetical protein